jgi:tetratricopeptide (TPR) repeat protein
MSTRYPDREELARFVRGELSAGDNRRIVQQLFVAYRDLPEDEVQRGAGRDRLFPDYDSLFEESAPCLTERAGALAVEREEAPKLLEHLGSLPRGERKARIRRDRTFQSWALCELMIEECHRLTYEGTFEAEEMADLAVTVAEELDPSYYGPSLVHDIHARAWAAAGSVLRVASDLRSADEAFLMAEMLVGQGTGDALEEAGILELKAALRRNQQRWSEAHLLLDDVVAIYRQYRDFHLVGRAFVQKGEIHGAMGELDQAIEWLRKGLSLIDSLRDRRLELAAQYSLMLFLHEKGRHEDVRDAWFRLKASRSEFREHGGELLNLRLRWLEGKIQQTLELFDDAEVALVEARRGFIEHEIGFDAALVSLDLASLYAELGRAAEVRVLAEEMMPIFQSRDIHREAIAALIVFQQAARKEGVSSSLLRKLGAYLRRARHDFKLRFEEQDSH